MQLLLFLSIIIIITCDNNCLYSLSSTDQTVLAPSIINQGPTTIIGGLGYSNSFTQGQLITAPVANNFHNNDATYIQGQTEATTLYNSIALTSVCNYNYRSAVTYFSDGKILPPGVYCFSGALIITGNIILDGQNTTLSNWVFRITRTLMTTQQSIISLINSARACQVLWQVTSTTIIGVNNQFVGSLLSMDSITVLIGTNVTGRIWSRFGTVSLDTNTVTIPTTSVFNYTSSCSLSVSNQNLTILSTTINSILFFSEVDSCIKCNISTNGTMTTSSNCGNAYLNTSFPISDCAIVPLLNTPLFSMSSTNINSTVVYNGDFSSLFVNCDGKCKICTNNVCTLNCFPKDNEFTELIFRIVIILVVSLTVGTFIYCFVAHPMNNNDGLPINKKL